MRELIIDGDVILLDVDFDIRRFFKEIARGSEVTLDGHCIKSRSICPQTASEPDYFGITRSFLISCRDAMETIVMQLGRDNALGVNVEADL